MSKYGDIPLPGDLVPRPTFQIEMKDGGTGICMRWVGVSRDTMDWIREHIPSQSKLLWILGRPADIYFDKDG